MRVQERMAAACHRSGRQLEDVKLIAVSKTFPAECIREAYEAGLRDFGENRVQEAAPKITALEGLEITWHLIGHLQSNKARRGRELFHWVHSVDSIHVASKLHQAAQNPSARLPILLQVNLAGEESKSGLAENEVLPAAEQVSNLPTLELRGLMLIPPFLENPEDVRPYFRNLRRLAEEIRAAFPAAREISMGMSH
ncbi:MAG TPA: YggS family pyridoxal phosphate-dependent enzyme, partial [Terriglobia bacterium]|nr:YggS family pyridoxal phosphate-dependent enzyme [Terriglobia bacterium]